MGPLIFMLLVSVSGFAAPHTSFELKVTDGAEVLEPAVVDVVENWSEAAVPSCQVFDFRVATFRKQQDELSRLLRGLEKSRGPSYSQKIVELRALLQRSVNLEHELIGQKVTATARFALVSPDWLVTRAYALKAQTPAWNWDGSDSSEPPGVRVDNFSDGVRVAVDYLLGDYCAGDNAEVRVELVRLATP